MSTEHNKFSHHAHILPLKVYLAIGGALMFLTVVTVAVAQIHLGTLNLVVALGIATIKAVLVGLYFMHLKYDSRLYSVVFVSSLSFLAIFIVITMSDTMRRGDLYPEVGHPIKAKAMIYDNPPKAAGHGTEGEAGHVEERKEGH